jgi:sensor histidine kinase YesM
MIYYGLIVAIVHAWDYYQRYEENARRNSQLEAQLVQAQLQALKMQLHPHFLFNTLNSISALLREDVEAADAMVARLGDFLRLTLDSAGAQEVTLREELSFLECYLEIEQVRFQDRLSTRMEVDPQILDARVPNLILQPIIENAIRHGVACTAKPGRIEIRATRRNDSLLVQVKDNGPGISTSGGPRKEGGEGVGLSNTRARLERLYGGAHRLELANVSEGGLLVTLEIPFETAGKGT